MSTDSSESEIENESKRKALPMQFFKWTQENEELLEEILMKHYFDFNTAAKEFSRIINDTLSSQKKEGEEP
jgi:hypothetical protein